MISQIMFTIQLALPKRLATSSCYGSLASNPVCGNAASSVLFNTSLLSHHKSLKGSTNSLEPISPGKRG